MIALRRLLLVAMSGLTACSGAASSGSGSDPGPAPSPDASPPGAAAVSTTLGDGVFTAEQARRGREVFRATCGECHSTRDFRGEKFYLSWDGVSVGTFVEELVATMPDDAPGSLPAQQYLDVVAYILEMNGHPAGDRELPGQPAVLEAIRIERAGEGG